MLTIFAGMAQFERKLLLQRCNEGRAVAVAKGVVMGRPKKGGSQLEYAIQLYKDKAMSVRDICQNTGVSKSTLCRRLKALGLTSMTA